MAVPEAGRDRQTRAIDRAGIRRDMRADRRDRVSLDEDDAVANRFCEGIDIDRPAHESRDVSIAIEVLSSIRH